MRKLGDADYRVREQASAALWRLGASAEPVLRRAAIEADAETAARAKDILARFDAGDYPDTPPEVTEQLRILRSPALPKQVLAFRTLVRMGPKAWPGLRAGLRRDLGKELRRGFFREASAVLHEEVARRLVTGEDDHALELLALNSYGPIHEGLLDYVVELQRRGKLNEAESALQARAGGFEAAESTEAARRTLLFVYRAQGRQDLAIREAEKLEGDDPTLHPIVDSLIEDRRDWVRLAARPVPNANSREGLKAFRLRQAGRLAEAETLLDLQVESEARDVQRNGSVDAATLALLLNDRTDDGLNRMKTLGNAPQIYADILSAKMRFREALTLLAIGPNMKEASDEQTAPLAVVRRARILHVLGDRTAADKLFDSVASDRVDEGRFRVDVLTQLIRAQVRCGRYDQAAEQYGRILQQGIDRMTIGQDGYELLFDGDADAARTLWRLHQHLGETARAGGAVMLRIRRLLNGTATADEYRAAEAKFAQAPPDLSLTDQAGAVAALQLAAGKPEDAVRTLTAAADNLPAPRDGELPGVGPRSGNRTWVFGTDESFRFWMDLADLLTDRGDDRAALKQLDRGLLFHPGHPILLYLAARSHDRTGQAAEAERLRALAHRTPLGNVRLRGRFLEELLNRGDAVEAKLEAEQVLRSAWLMETFIGNVWNQVGRAAVLNKDFTSARFAYAKAIHYLLRTPGIAYVEGTGYFSVPMNLKLYEVRELLAADKTDAAVAKAKAVIAESPASTDMVIAVAAKLDACDRKPDADALFAASWAGFRKLLADHPQCSWAEAQAAWLAAGCRRELPAARAYAAAAVEREPHIRFHREALAEVCFRLGKRGEAAELMRTLIREDRRNAFYKRQLERYRNGDIDGPLPDADD